MAVAVSGALFLTGAARAEAASSGRDDTAAAVRTALGTSTLGGDGTGIDIALLDTGVMTVPGVPADHVLYGPDFTLDALNPNFRGLDDFGHGTNMASLVLDAAPGARIVSVKVGSASSPATLAGILGGIDWTVKNAHTEGRNIRVINVSFGLTPDSDGGLVAAALRKAWAAGIVVVAAAGNQGNTASRLDAPANDNLLIAVGAESMAPETAAPFSSGASAFLARVPDLLAPGVGLVGARVPGSFLDVSYPEARVGDDGFRGSGTSQAAALTSGAIADLLQRRPDLGPDQVKYLLTGTAKPLAGVPNFVQGKGAVNPARAGSTPTPTRAWAVLSNGSLLQALRLPTLAQLLTPLSGVIWNGDPWNGNRWSGNRWSGNRWSGDHWE